ncbi:MAG: type I methionyl aminopeptidase [Actinobacteria bacterium]|nr:type I methionyl aminopeptidase [Actinomycetota bacterium]
MIIIKTPEEIAIMREAGLIVAKVLELIEKRVKPGVTGVQIDRFAERFIRSAGASPAFKGYRGFPASICFSINEGVVHGIPSAKRLKEGDIVSVDVGVEYKGYYADAAATFAAGEIDEEARRLMETTKTCLEAGIAQARVGNYLGDIGSAIQSVAESAGFSVVRDLVGHGIGRAMHEDPQIPNYGRPKRGPRLEPGMVLAIEPMINAGVAEVTTLDDHWTVLTADGGLSAHFEHSVALTERTPLVLTSV